MALPVDRPPPAHTPAAAGPSSSSSLLSPSLGPAPTSAASASASNPPRLPASLVPQVDSLERVLEDLQSFQIPQLADCRGPPARFDQLTREVRQELARSRRDLDELRLDVDDLDRARDRDNALWHVDQLQLLLDQCTKLYRSAVVHAKRVIDSSQHYLNREELLLAPARTGSDSPAPGGPPPPPSGEDALMAATSDVTEGLRRTLQLLQSEVDRSQVSNELLEQQTETMASTTAQYSTLSSLLSASKHLVTSLERADVLDRLVLFGAFSFFVAVCSYIFKKRVVDRGLGVATAVTGVLGRRRGGGGASGGALAAKELVRQEFAGEVEKIAMVTAAVVGAVKKARDKLLQERDSYPKTTTAEENEGSVLTGKEEQQRRDQLVVEDVPRPTAEPTATATAPRRDIEQRPSAAPLTPSILSSSFVPPSPTASVEQDLANDEEELAWLTDVGIEQDEALVRLGGPEQDEQEAEADDDEDDGEEPEDAATSTVAAVVHEPTPPPAQRNRHDATTDDAYSPEPTPDPSSSSTVRTGAPPAEDDEDTANEAAVEVEVDGAPEEEEEDDETPPPSEPTGGAAAPEPEPEPFVAPPTRTPSLRETDGVERSSASPSHDDTLDTSLPHEAPFEHDLENDLDSEKYDVPDPIHPRATHPATPAYTPDELEAIFDSDPPRASTTTPPPPVTNPVLVVEEEESQEAATTTTTTDEESSLPDDSPRDESDDLVSPLVAADADLRAAAADAEAGGRGAITTPLDDVTASDGDDGERTPQVALPPLGSDPVPDPTFEIEDPTHRDDAPGSSVDESHVEREEEGSDEERDGDRRDDGASFFDALMERQRGRTGDAGDDGALFLDAMLDSQMGWTGDSIAGAISGNATDPYAPAVAVAVVEGNLGGRDGRVEQEQQVTEMEPHPVEVERDELDEEGAEAAKEEPPSGMVGEGPEADASTPTTTRTEEEAARGHESELEALPDLSGTPNEPPVPLPTAASGAGSTTPAAAAAAAVTQTTVPVPAEAASSIVYEELAAPLPVETFVDVVVERPDPLAFARDDLVFDLNHDDSITEPVETFDAQEEEEVPETEDAGALEESEATVVDLPRSPPTAVPESGRRTGQDDSTSETLRRASVPESETQGEPRPVEEEDEGEEEPDSIEAAAAPEPASPPQPVVAPRAGTATLAEETPDVAGSSEEPFDELDELDEEDDDARREEDLIAATTRQADEPTPSLSSTDDSHEPASSTDASDFGAVGDVTDSDEVFSRADGDDVPPGTEEQAVDAVMRDAEDEDEGEDNEKSGRARDEQGQAAEDPARVEVVQAEHSAAHIEL
ncbi:hypothetical protein JCM11491_005016 [Sporobolomyces phaffii]